MWQKWTIFPLFLHSYLIWFLIIDNLNPNWIKKLIIPFNFNIKQQLRFEIFDFDPYSKNEFLGRADLTLAQIVSANGGIYKQSLKTGFANFNRVGGELWLQAEEINSNKEIAFIQFSANNLGLNSLIDYLYSYLTIIILFVYIRQERLFWQIRSLFSDISQ